MTRKLEGKVALITGSGRGIGRSIALKLASEGASIVVNDLDAEPAEETVQAIREAGGQAVACVGSVTAPDFAERFVGTAVSEYKGIDIVVNNAGYTWDNVIQKMSDEQWYAMIDCHLTAPFRILRAAQPIISKLAKEWGRYAVTVNCVAFGYIQTRLTKPLAEGEAGTIEVAGRQVKVGVQGVRIAAMNQMIPLGRGGLPAEAAGAVYLFCSPDSDYVSGQTLVCGGGFTG